MKTESGDQEPDILETTKQKKFNYFQSKEQKNIDMRLLTKYFPYKRPDRILQTLCNLKSKADNYGEVSSIYGIFSHFAGKFKEMLSVTKH